MKKVKRTAIGVLAAALGVGAQEAPPPRLPASVQAIEVEAPGGAILSFRHRGTTTVELKGTERMPNASVSLKVESRPGFVEIDINRGAIKGLRPAWRFGRDFLTYVLWVVSVDGAAMNVGEITFEHGIPISINVTTTYQTFWMMVTAEPDFAVHDPSPVVVLVSQSQKETPTGSKARPVPGALIYHTNYTEYDSRPPDETAAGGSSELLQARKAVELASQAGILARPTPTEEEPLPDEIRTRETLRLAQTFLAEAETKFEQMGASRQTIQFARTAAQIAENARALALGAVGGIVLRQLSREIEKLQTQKNQASEQLTQAERELTSLRDRFTQLEASLDQERRRTRQLEGGTLALQERLNVLERALASARQETALLKQERDNICEELHRQLTSLGQLSERGGRLVLTLASDILFDFDRYDLRPAARENLAKLAVVRLLLFPTAPVRYEGHTDLVGEEDYNQWLSEQRALSVYRYILAERLIRFQHEGDERAPLEEQLSVVEELLRMSYNAARRQPSRRQELLARLGNAVVGQGMREPVVPETGPNEQNRRVTLIFPEVQAGEVTSLCPAVAQTP